MQEDINSPETKKMNGPIASWQHTQKKVPQLTFAQPALL